MQSMNRGLIPIAPPRDRQIQNANEELRHLFRKEKRAAARQMTGTDDFSVLVSSVFVPNFAVYRAWLTGLSVDECHAQNPALHNGTISALSKSTGISPIKKYVQSQYRSYDQMEHYLHRPQYFGEQFLYPLPVPVKLKLIEMYYSFDEIVLRELLSKKLNSRSRKDLDDIVLKTSIQVGSCRRQFNNLKRVFRRVEDSSGSLIRNIQDRFHLSKQLASQYANVIFINSNRIDTTKKKLQLFSLDDFEYCASVFMRLWSYFPQDSYEEFDSQLSQDCREIKQIIFSGKEVQDELRSTVTASLLELSQSPNGLSPAFTSSLAQNNTFLNIFSASNRSSGADYMGTSWVNSPRDFGSQLKVLVRSMISIGVGLGYSKEIRDLFIDILEKVVEPCQANGWKESDINAFFNSLREAWSKLSTIPAATRERLQSAWNRMATGMQRVSKRLFRPQ